MRTDYERQISRKQTQTPTLSNEPVQVLVVGSLNPKISTAYIVNRLVIHHETAIRVLKGGMGGEDRIVWLHDGGSDLRSRVNTELQLAFLAIIRR